MKAEEKFKALFEGSDKNEHVPLPKSVTDILKRQHKGYTLHAFIYHDRRDDWYDGKKDHRTMMLGFDRIEGKTIMRGPGVCCGMEGCVHDLSDLAEEIAASWPDYAIDKEMKD